MFSVVAFIKESTKILHPFHSVYTMKRHHLRAGSHALAKQVCEHLDVRDNVL